MGDHSALMVTVCGASVASMLRNGSRKASAGIIGSLPIAVMGLVYLTTPAYIGVLFTTRTGNLLLASCVFWMSIGVMVMRKMINFKH